MRANTSLISHILGSHPQINGYYEMHQHYCNNDDLIKQTQRLTANKETNKKNQAHRYLFDKILHNKYQFLLTPLQQAKPSKKIMIFISTRPAAQTIKSIMYLFANKKSQHVYAQADQAVQYYIERLNYLSQFCQQNKQQYYYYDADLIRTNTDKSLRRIEYWLSLTIPLKENYQLFSLTGQAKIGDSSENMKTGQIIQKQRNYDDIILPSHLLQRAEDISQHYRQHMINHAMDTLIF
jgi:hypothetical protein